MFIYLVAPVATLLIIFGLLHVKCLDNWLRSSVRCTRTLYNGLICRPAIQASLNSNEDLESSSTDERSLTVTGDTAEYQDASPQRLIFGNNERLSDVLLVEAGSNTRNLIPSRYSFENVLLEERDRNFGLPAATTLQLGTAQDSVIETSKQEGKENIYESWKSSIEKTSYPSTRLNTKQIYNLLMKETLKENEARQKLLGIDKSSKLNESQLIEIKRQIPSSSENVREDNNNNDE